MADAAMVLLDTEDRGTVDNAHLSAVLLERGLAASGASRLVRLHRPERTVAFSRLESHLPGFPAAVTAAACRGFTPIVRPTGGRAVSYDRSSWILDVIEPSSRQPTDNRSAFAGVAHAIAEALRRCGVDAAVGQVEGEYCPGRYSVHARGIVKLAGVAQRLTPTKRLTSALIVLGDPTASREALEDVNAELGFEWDPTTYGAASEERPGITDSDLSDAVISAMCRAEYAVVPVHRLCSELFAPGAGA